MMKPELNLSYFTWYIKYIGIPLTVGVSMYKYICNEMYKKKRRASLEGKVVVITGASSGIGEALAHAFYEQGSKVILASRRLSELNRVKGDLSSKKMPLSTQEPEVLELDLADTDHLDSFVQKVYAICGHIDILINNGGVSHRGSILQTKLEVDKRIMTINYLGSVALTKAVLPKMVQNKSGHIVFVSSVQGLIAIPDRSAYAASKHAMQAFGDCLRAEMKQHNINVSVVSPGYVRTAISLNAFTGSGEQNGVMEKDTYRGFTAESVADKILDTVVFKQNELVYSQFLPKLAITLRHSVPSLYFWFMYRRANKTEL